VDSSPLEHPLKKAFANPAGILGSDRKIDVTGKRPSWGHCSRKKSSPLVDIARIAR
jgi:hypothetical protein